MLSPEVTHSILRSRFQHTGCRNLRYTSVQSDILKETSKTGGGRALRIRGKVPGSKGLLNRGPQVEAADAGGRSGGCGRRGRSVEGDRIPRRSAFCGRLCGRAGGKRGLRAHARAERFAGAPGLGRDGGTGRGTRDRGEERGGADRRVYGAADAFGVCRRQNRGRKKARGGLPEAAPRGIHFRPNLIGAEAHRGASGGVGRATGRGRVVG
jgi:hypothetical protein